MAVNNITQTISTVPTAGHRGVDVQTVFVNKQEAFQDALTDVFVGEINTLKTQLNTFVSEVNSTATAVNNDADSASTSASTATTKASEASTSASQALTSRNQAETFKNQASDFADEAESWANTAQTVVENKVTKAPTTDNAIMRANGTTGEIQGSGVTIEDNGSINFPTGSRITGDFSNATHSNRVAFQTSVINGTTSPFFIPNGTGTLGQVVAGSSSDASNTSFISISANGTAGVTSITSSSIGAGTVLPMIFNIGGPERMRIETNGNVLLKSGTGALGYGTGAGETVTQLISKSTAVAVHKPSGLIIMDSGALASGGFVYFQVFSSTFSANDSVIVNFKGGGIDYSSYRLGVSSDGNGGYFYISIENRSSTSKSEAVRIKYEIIKGAVS